MSDKNIRKVSEIDSSPKERREEFYKRVDSSSLELREAVIQYLYMLNKNQAEFAKFTKTPLRTLRDFEQGRGNSTFETLLKFLRGSGLELSVRRK